MGCSKTSTKGEMCSSKCLHWKQARSQIDLTLQLKELEKEEQTKLKDSI